MIPCRHLRSRYTPSLDASGACQMGGRSPVHTNHSRLTGGFAAVNQVHVAALSIAGVGSVVALAGMVSVVGLVVGVVLLVAILGRALL